MNKGGGTAVARDILGLYPLVVATGASRLARRNVGAAASGA
jgi:hypothetical protein